MNIMWLQEVTVDAACGVVDVDADRVRVPYHSTTRSQHSQECTNTRRGKPGVQRPVDAIRMCSVVLVVRRGITVGKTQRGLRAQQQRQYCVLSEDRHRRCDLHHMTFWPNNKWISRTHCGTFVCHVRSVLRDIV